MIKARDYVAINFPARSVQKKYVHNLFTLSHSLAGSGTLLDRSLRLLVRSLAI